jgi:hypothetical protein
MPVKIKDHIKLNLPEFGNELQEISGLASLLVPNPSLLNGGQTLNDRLISLPEKEMDLAMRVVLFDSAGKMARKDGISNESCLDDENCFRRGVSHALRLTHNYGKDHGDNPDI